VTRNAEHEVDLLMPDAVGPGWPAMVVTDAGGVASHPAVVAREFGIPAVVGTSIATQRIASGDRVRVNGTSGIVEVLR